MKILCLLPEDINNCAFCNKERMECTNTNTKCTFRKESDENIVSYQYVRKERWYEKYYKDNTPRKG